MCFKNSYRQLKVLVTGDTGFKGAWLSWWLHQLGANVYGLALPCHTEQDLFQIGRLDQVIHHHDGDIRDYECCLNVIDIVKPDIIFHLAAQSLVRESYYSPLMTVETNMSGTVHIMEALRVLNLACPLIVVTSDKCYENKEMDYNYCETDAMGGYDVYSASKGCVELLVSAYRRSFFDLKDIRVATVRAGNVIGPGDWACNRLIPDAVRALAGNMLLEVRSPDAIRPWQHVLEPLSGYLWLGALLLSTGGRAYADAWNFGPNNKDILKVRDVLDLFFKEWGRGAWHVDAAGNNGLHEAILLSLNIEKAKTMLQWAPVWDVKTAIRYTAQGYLLLQDSVLTDKDVRNLMTEHIEAYVRKARELSLVWCHS